jgi:hypothetical protein
VTHDENRSNLTQPHQSVTRAHPADRMQSCLQTSAGVPRKATQSPREARERLSGGSAGVGRPCAFPGRA